MIYKINTYRNFIAAFAVFLSCSTIKQTQLNTPKVDIISTAVPADTVKTDVFLESLLRSYPQYFDTILQHQKDWNIQIIYTQINRGVNGIPALQHHYFNVNAAHYFYPASTVKLPLVLLALQKLNELKDKGIDRNTAMITEAAYSRQSSVYNDPSTTDGKPTIAQYIKKILLVSDNDAYNRLYEFLGQDYINSELHKKGYEDVQILHRLNIFLTEEENRRTNPLVFVDSKANALYKQSEQNNKAKYLQRNDSMGMAYYKGGELMNGAMDFSKKNRISLEDLHNIMVSLVFPNKVKAGQRFNISEDDRQFVLNYMSRYPTESLFPPYAADTAKYWPAFCKFLLYGSQKGKLPDNIRIFNKVGDAYGQMIDVAYVVDFKNSIEFFVSAVIYCNSDGILNDDKYDYNTIGLPFMKNLGKVIYDYELKRSYRIKPDLSALSFMYDK